MHYNETLIGSELVKQKDIILHMCNDEKFTEAISMLAVVRSMWVAVDYGYKGLEIIGRIRNQLLANEDVCESKRIRSKLDVSFPANAWKFEE